MDFKYQGMGTYKRDKGGKFSSLKAKIRKIWYWMKVGTVISIALLLAFLFGGAFWSTSMVTATTKIVELEAQMPILDRIADCESGVRLKSGKAIAGSRTHYDKNGQVLMRPNTNGSIDVGKYQINSVWFKQASTLKLDITKEQDNKSMAEWIYANRGTGDWYSSANCWSK